MPKNTAIKSILVIGSGPINIGQACEFDYSGTQAIKALREEGYRVILVNSNPATIMTDSELADATYIEPITPAYVTAVIEKERPDAMIATLGGQTSLNCALSLHKSGVLAQYHVQLIGASVEAITLAEDRSLFHQKMIEIGLDIPKSYTATTVDEAMAIVAELGLPVLVRSSFSLGGAGAALVKDAQAAIEIFKSAFSATDHQFITIDEALIGWKEFELEVVRDHRDNCIVICGVENFDPLGIHTGDSITVAPIQTLNDKDYQCMRDAAFAVLRAVGVDTGGSNVQFAVHPQTGRMVVIEMNPRVSRPSALVSKATGFPIAKIAAKLAVGYTLDELRNDITAHHLPAAFEPSIDYVVVKIPRFHDEKFHAEDVVRGPQMRSVGEVMAIGSTFTESLQLAMQSLELGGCELAACAEVPNDHLRTMLGQHTSTHLWSIFEGFRRGFSIDEIYGLSSIDPWFLEQIQSLVRLEETCHGKMLSDLNHDELFTLKKNGFADQQLAMLLGTTELAVWEYRQVHSIRPVYKCVDSCAGEFKTATAYLYSTYQTYCESAPSLHRKIMILGSGPNRIGQGIEFDYVCVKAIQAFRKAGYETIMVNCNPETVSTDYDVANKLYFIPLTREKILDLIEKEQPTAVALSFGGQTPLNLVETLHRAGVPLLGLTAEIVDITEDREKFRSLIQQLGLQQPKNIAISTPHAVEDALASLTFPVIIRPSFILGGSDMQVIDHPALLRKKLKGLFQRTPHAVLLEEFLQDAIEVDVDAVCDGEDVFIPTILEHIESAGVHSGDSACITPPYQLPEAMVHLIHQQTKALGLALQLKGLMNVQFAVKGSEVFLIEVNPRASRTTPFICKATGLNLIDIAVNCMLGVSLKAQRCLSRVHLPLYFVKEAVIPFRKFPKASPLLSPEMKGMGEVMGIGRSPYEAYLKAQIAAGQEIDASTIHHIFVSGLDEQDPLLETMRDAGFHILYSMEGESQVDLVIAVDPASAPISYALTHHIPYVSTREAASMMIKSLIHSQKEKSDVYALKEIYQHIQHPHQMRHLLTGLEFTTAELLALLQLAARIKKNPVQYQHLLSGKNLAMIFEKPSFRTRLSFSLAIQSLGGTAIESVSQTRKQEDPCDLMRVLNGYSDWVMMRTHDDAVLQAMATYATVPIINGLSALHHPCQVLADLFTLQTCFGDLNGLTIAYVGDGNNILHSLLLLAPQLGVNIQYCCPERHQPDAEIVAQCMRQTLPGKICAYTEPHVAVKQADAVYTDVWTSMGFEQQGEAAFQGLQVNECLMAHAKPEAVFMHCMPMERGKEVSHTLPDAPHSVIFEQSENRLHVQKAILWCLGQPV